MESAGPPSRCPTESSIVAFLVGHTAASERAWLEEHLSACHTCRQVVAVCASGSGLWAVAPCAAHPAGVLVSDDG